MRALPDPESTSQHCHRALFSLCRLPGKFQINFHPLLTFKASKKGCIPAFLGEPGPFLFPRTALSLVGSAWPHVPGPPLHQAGGFQTTLHLGPGKASPVHGSWASAHLDLMETEHFVFKFTPQHVLFYCFYPLLKVDKMKTMISLSFKLEKPPPCLLGSGLQY